MEKEYNLLESYEWFGTFWISEKETEQFSGKLFYDPTGRMYLEVIVYDDAYFFDKKNHNKELNTIYGVIKGNKGIQKVTLSQCIMYVSGSSLGVGSILIISISTIIMGEHFKENAMFLSCSVEYKYIDEFIGSTRKNITTDSIIGFELNEKLKISISPYIHGSFFADFFISKKALETENEYKIRLKELSDFQSYVNEKSSKIGVYTKTGKKENYICSFYRKDNDTESQQTLILSAYNFKKILTFLMCKKVYIEKIFLLYKRDKEQTFTNSAFVFKTINNLDSEQVKELPESSVWNEMHNNPFNIELLNRNNIEDFINLINDESNSLLIDYLFNFIEIDFVTHHKSKEMFVLVMSLLEREYYDLYKSNKDEEKKYDLIIEKYIDDEIRDILLSILKSDSIDNNVISLHDILSTSNTYYLGSILSFFRNKIVHNQKDVKIGFLDTKEKKEIKDKYQSYWSNNDYVFHYILRAISVLLLKIMYSKIGLNTKNFQEVLNRLFFKYFGSKQDRGDRIQKLIIENTER